MSFLAPKKTSYDWWFDESVPKAKYGSLQCWIYNEHAAKWASDVDISMHSMIYEMAAANTILLGGCSDGMWGR